jgi:hypothetical protein
MRGGDRVSQEAIETGFDNSTSILSTPHEARTALGIPVESDAHQDYLTFDSMQYMRADSSLDACNRLFPPRFAESIRRIEHRPEQHLQEPILVPDISISVEEGVTRTQLGCRVKIGIATGVQRAGGS